MLLRLLLLTSIVATTAPFLAQGQTQAAMQLTQQWQSPQAIEHAITTHLHQAMQKNGWVLSLRKTLKGMIFALDGMRETLVSAEKALR